MFHAALLLNVAFVITIAWVSHRHFARNEREPVGARAVSLATAAGTLANVWLASLEPRPGLVGLTSALILCASAFAVLFAALHATRNGGLALAFSEQTPKAVVANGIYGVIRHPFYTSYCLYWLSWIPLTNAHPMAVAIGGAMIAIYVAAVLKEERLLSARLGRDYIPLMRRTWRLLPGVY